MEGRGKGVRVERARGGRQNDGESGESFEKRGSFGGERALDARDTLNARIRVGKGKRSDQHLDPYDLYTWEKGSSNRGHRCRGIVC